ncbi:tetratricopeptide repeat protein [candidate division KSB1 bacterium]|nr:tetratricopeptide repeat protein [candidate division KSB1 bacterium]
MPSIKKKKSQLPQKKKDAPARPRNLRIFYFILFALPLVFLLLLEGVLRLLTDDPITPLVVRREERGKPFYQLNARVGERFFLGGVAAVPEVYPQRFAYTKPNNGLRVFCLGASTMASFPYELHARVSSLLQDRLQLMYPDRTVEVINAGMAAINSYAVVEFARELAQYEPDLFVMYLGHNEFYGALGVGSTQSLGQNRGLVRLYLRLQKFRTFMLLRRLIVAVRQGLQSNTNVPAGQQTLMEGMAAEKTIRFESEMYRRGLAQFRDNLAEILAIAQQQRVPIIVGTLVSNLRDMAPFASEDAPDLPAEQKRQWQKLFEQGWQLQRQQNYAEAKRLFQEVAAIDSASALLYFRLGQTHAALGEIDAARKSYETARDLDLLRFRAPGEFNKIIREICSTFSAPVVEMEEAFARQSPHGLIGHELISEHLHPNFDGYFLMAKTFAQAIRQHQELVPGLHAVEGEFDDQFLRDYSAVTLFDLQIGNRKIERLTKRWPFRREQFTFPPDSLQAPAVVRQLVEEYQANRIAWNAAHFQLAEEYQRQGKGEEALREYRAVMKVVPENDAAYTRMADLLLQQNRFAAADSLLQIAMKWNEQSPFVRAKLGLVNFMQHRFAAAAEHFQTALNLNNMRQAMSANDLAAANYYLALCRVQLGQLEFAQTHLAEVLRSQPQHDEAKRLLLMLQKGIEVKLEF